MCKRQTKNGRLTSEPTANLRRKVERVGYLSPDSASASALFFEAADVSADSPFEVPE